MTILALFWLMLIPLLPILVCVLLTLLCRDAIRAITRRWESRPVWSVKDEAELRDLMRQSTASE